MPDLTISIGGRDFEVSCQEGEEHFLRTAAGMLDGEASALLGQIGRLPEARMLLMVGLMVADKAAGMEDQLRDQQGRLDEIETQMAEAQRLIDAARAEAQAKSDAAQADAEGRVAAVLAEAESQIAAAQAEADSRIEVLRAEAQATVSEDPTEAAHAEAARIIAQAHAEADLIRAEAVPAADPVEVHIEVPVIPEALLISLETLAARAEELADRVEDVA